ncbi:PVC-type heme-binding CxxCH protein [Prosthecobacter sp.]|uniref:PVC-type heme-binding CxxCH protein n=1 Tax=Prosthecobacter sp. TaxID=1965333 RepID=UPI002AB941CB|nr:PVC-type heme-binding CxxCH protein [Prosthecobacter sp.]MDZ4401144.1 PVC-type heme-binding CxxCH protein [Prosthecobacter sp.]
MRHLPLLAFLLTTSAFAEPVSLFDGKTLDGWDFDPAMWRVEDGVITGGSTTEKIKKNDFISTKKSYQNFELKLKIKVSGDPKTGMLNSGIQIRSVRDGSAMSGYQVDCGAGWFGKIYDEHRRNKVIWAPTPEQQAALDKAIDVFGWNEYVIRAEGPRIQTWINGVHCMDYTETDPNIALDGHIAPQVHSGGVCLVQVKDVTIEELPATPGAPTWKSIGGLEGMKAKLPPKPQANATAPKRDISYNNVQGTALTAQEQLKKFHLPEGYEIELVVQESEGLGKFVSVYFDQRGRMWTQTALEYPVDSNENPAAAEAVYAGKGKDKVLVYPRESLNGKIPEGGLTDATVFADGLAIPLGILPWGNGDTCYVQHGHDLKLYKDTNGDGKADTFDVVLTGFGVQDSHLFPHQFTRAPGGWIWMAQGLFNNSKVHKPGSDVVVDWPKCSMARMRPDGSEFEVISTGPNNIWGLVITGEGETFIQEANDYGYPVMPFHEYAYYPGGMEALKKSYQPDFPPMTDVRMGGTGLSGLALIESGPLSPSAVPQSTVVPAHVMAVANPIISKIQTIAMHRDGAYWKLAQLPDLITCDDPFFRPVALTNGPDGCIYIVDWYNKIISHNEVPRAHPDRDKTRGRIWRVKPKGAKTEVADFTKLNADELIDILGTEPAAKAHLAWQTLADRPSLAEWDEAWSVYFLDKLKKKELQPKSDVSKLISLFHSQAAAASKRIQSLWVLREVGPHNKGAFPLLDQLELHSPSRLPTWPETKSSNLDREIVSACEDPNWTSVETCAAFAKLATSTSSSTRCMVIRAVSQLLRTIESGDFRAQNETLTFLLAFAKPSLPGPTIQSSRAPKQIPVREAYDREFERFLVRMFLERHPEVVAKFLDSEAAAKLPVEARVLASLALEPKASASRVAKLLPQLDRAPNDEELLRLAQFPAEAGVGEALQALLTNEKSRAAVAEKLLAQRTKLDAAKIAPLLTETAKSMIGSADTPVRSLALQIIGGFQLTALEGNLIAMLKQPVSGASSVSISGTGGARAVLVALRELRSGEAELFARIAESDPDQLVREEAVTTLAASRAPDAATKLLALYPNLQPTQRRTALNTLSSTKAGAKTIVTALLDKTLPQADLDGPTVERLATVLGDDPAITKLQQQLGGIFREVLLLDGQDTAWVDSKITLDGPFTVEAWVRLAPGISNEDSLLGVRGGVDMNFFGGKFRVYAGSELHDVCVATKPMTPDLWTHLAVTRDAQGIIRIYQNGELDATGSKPAPAKWENCKIGWSGPKQGTEGAMMEFRVWKTARSATEIRSGFDRSYASHESHKTYLKVGEKLGQGARIAKTIDTPPLLTEEQAKALDAKFAKFSALAPKGNAANGKVLSALCIACHQIGNAGGQIGPNLSGAGAMGLEAVLRNILTPNAAMEPGYRIFRVEMKNGDLIDAFFVSEDKQATIIRQPGLPDRRVNKPDIRSTKFIRRSLMPEGLLDTLHDQQVADLLAYLMTLKG